MPGRELLGAESFVCSRYKDAWWGQFGEGLGCEGALLIVLRDVRFSALLARCVIGCPTKGAEVGWERMERMSAKSVIGAADSGRADSGMAGHGMAAWTSN